MRNLDQDQKEEMHQEKEMPLEFSRGYSVSEILEIFCVILNGISV